VKPFSSLEFALLDRHSSGCNRLVRSSWIEQRPGFVVPLGYSRVSASVGCALAEQECPLHFVILSCVASSGITNKGRLRRTASVRRDAFKIFHSAIRPTERCSPSRRKPRRMHPPIRITRFSLLKTSRGPCQSPRPTFIRGPIATSVILPGCGGSVQQKIHPRRRALPWRTVPLSALAVLREKGLLATVGFRTHRNLGRPTSQEIDPRSGARFRVSECRRMPRIFNSRALSPRALARRHRQRRTPMSGR